MSSEEPEYTPWWRDYRPHPIMSLALYLGQALVLAGSFTGSLALQILGGVLVTPFYVVVYRHELRHRGWLRILVGLLLTGALLVVFVGPLILLRGVSNIAAWIAFPFAFIVFAIVGTKAARRVDRRLRLGHHRG